MKNVKCPFSDADIFFEIWLPQSKVTSVIRKIRMWRTVMT